MAALVRIERLAKSHRHGDVWTPALRGLDLEIEEGSLTAVVGPSGCGKSTLLTILGGLDRASSGSARVGELELVGASTRQLVAYRRRAVAMIFQSFNLLPSLDVLENVLVGLELSPLSASACRARARAALEELGLSHLARRYPAQLSGGEQQRVAVARALARSPRLLLADEPTGNLDRAAGRLVCEAIADLVKRAGTTCVLVTHDEDAARSADRVVALRDGVVVDGSCGRAAASGFYSTARRAATAP